MRAPRRLPHSVAYQNPRTVRGISDPGSTLAAGAGCPSLSAMDSSERNIVDWVRSMRVRIVLLVATLLLVSSLGSLLLLRTALLGSLDREVEASLDREAEEFTRLSTGNDPRTGAPFAGDLPAIFDVYFSREVPDEGETLLAFVEGDLYASRRAQDAASPEELEDATRYWLSLSEREQGSLDTPGGTSRYVALPVEGADGTDGLFVVANFPTFERAEIDEAVRTQSIIQVGVFVVASLLALILAGRVLRPLGDLAVAAREISETDLGKRIPVRGRDEASQIAATFNAMLARLQRAFRDQRQFLDDTGHELRAPLTIIRGHVELIELDEEPETRRATAALVLDEIDRASRLIDDLLLLARAEQPDFIRPAPTDLVDLVLRSHEKATMLAERHWRVVTPDPVVVDVDPDRLTQAILQLAHNATKHTGAEDPIEIGGEHTGELLRLWVDDSGSGVDEADRQLIFERFRKGHRGEEQGGETTGGTGLGLAIVAAIARNHGGTLSLMDRPGPGAGFEIRIPLDGDGLTGNARIT